MQHHFDVDLAVIYGVTEAILLNHLEYWIEQNRANGRNFFEGRYWTFNSNKAMKEIFPYLSDKKIRNALKHLQDEGIILTGNFNKLAYDRTLWYAFTEKGESILPKGQMEVPKRSNGSSEKGEPIPPNDPPNDPPDNSSRSASASLDFERFWKLYPVKKAKQQALKAWKKINPDSQLTETIIAAVEKQKKWPDWIKDNGQYIPYPSTWLNQGRWDDEDNTPSVQQQPKKLSYRTEIIDGEEVVIYDR